MKQYRITEVQPEVYQIEFRYSFLGIGLGWWRDGEYRPYGFDSVVWHAHQYSTLWEAQDVLHGYLEEEKKSSFKKRVVYTTQR